MMIEVHVSYRREWSDGYGARGWKLDVALDDPEVIAATAETGRRLPTSVLVHDILDHHLCGLALGGHRNEAIALHQLALRTGADPLPDLLQMVDEDLLHGRVVGESMLSFLPEYLRASLPAGMDDGRIIAQHLITLMGRENLRQALARHMQAIGREAAGEAEARYRQHGLEHGHRSHVGLALQKLFAQIDAIALREDWATAHAIFALSDTCCAIKPDLPRTLHLQILCQ